MTTPTRRSPSRIPWASPPGHRPAKGKGLVGPRRAPNSGSPPRGTAKDRALRLLGVRSRSREELRRRLLAAGFPAEEVATAVRDLEAVGLVDDERFAGEWARDRASRRLDGDRVVRSSL